MARIISPASSMSARWRDCATISRSSALSASRASAEPEDHAAVLCEIMAGLAGGRFEAPAGADRELFEKHLAPWIGRFFTDLEHAKGGGLLPPSRRARPRIHGHRARGFRAGIVTRQTRPRGMRGEDRTQGVSAMKTEKQVGRRDFLVRSGRVPVSRSPHPEPLVEEARPTASLTTRSARPDIRRTHRRSRTITASTVIQRSMRRPPC